MAQLISWAPKTANEPNQAQDISLEERAGSDAEEETLGFDPTDEEHRSLLTLQPTMFNEKHTLFLGRDSKKAPNQLKFGLIGKAFLAYGQNAVLFLLPSFIACSLRRESRSTAQPRYTTYLDGLRGLAAWAVFNTHLCARLSQTAGASWGAQGHHEVYRLPGIRLIYSGDFAVNLFFVISGFALSISPINEMRKSPRNSAAAMSRLAGSIFRRPIRLFGPPFASIFLVFILIRLDFFEAWISRLEEYNRLVPGWDIGSLYAPKDPSIFAQFVDMLYYDFELLQVFTLGLRKTGTYNGVVWTIPFEFRASLMLMITHAAFFYMRKPMRTACCTLLIFLSMICHSWDMPLFWAGYLIAEYSDFSSPQPILGQSWIKRSRILTPWWVVFGIGIYLGSYPQWKPAETPFYAWLDPYTLPGTLRFWTSIGGALTVLAITRIPLLIRILSTPPIHYLGQISFALYLVHFWIIHIIGTWMYYNAWNYTGKDSDFMTLTGFAIAYPMLLFVTIWVADIFWRAVDMPLVALAAKVHKRLCQET